MGQLGGTVEPPPAPLPSRDTADTDVLLCLRSSGCSVQTPPGCQLPVGGKLSSLKVRKVETPPLPQPVCLP